jgi:hypothetical protein
MTSAEIPNKPARHHVLLVLLLICTLGVGLRAYHALVAVAISPDSALFIDYARELPKDPLAALRRYQQHPLYPGLILLFHEPVGWFAGDGSAGWIFAGRLAAILGSLGAILALYWFAARLYDQTRGLIAAALLAVLPDACRFGADVLTDSPHLALYLAGLAALATGMQTERRGYLLLAAGVAAPAFLTRPEGASVLLVGLVVVLLHRRWNFKRRIGLTAAMIAVFLCLAGPYQLATGQLIQKKPLRELFRPSPAAQLNRPDDHPECRWPAPASVTRLPLLGGHERASAPWRAAVIGEAGAEQSDRPLLPTDAWLSRATNLPVPIDVLRQWFRAGRVVYILLAILGVVIGRPRGVAGRILGAAIGVHLVLLHVLEYRYGYLDRRHALILATLSLPLAAEGVWWLADRISFRAGGTQTAARPAVVIAIIALCVLGTGPWLLRPINPGEEHIVASARWLARHTEPDALIVTDNRLRRVALYADRPFAEWPWWQGSVSHLAKFLDKNPGSYFVVDVRHITLPKRNPAFFEELKEQFGDQMELLHCEPAPPHARPTEIRVYRYHARQVSASPY